jgi:amino acid permease
MLLLRQAALTYFTLAVLVHASAQTGAATYSQLVRVTCGPVPMKVLQLSVLSFCFGFSVVYLVSAGLLRSMLSAEALLFGCIQQRCKINVRACTPCSSRA